MSELTTPTAIRVVALELAVKHCAEVAGARHADVIVAAGAFASFIAEGPGNVVSDEKPDPKAKAATSAASTAKPAAAQAQKTTAAPSPASTAAPTVSSEKLTAEGVGKQLMATVEKLKDKGAKAKDIVSQVLYGKPFAELTPDEQKACVFKNVPEDKWSLVSAACVEALK